MIFDLNFDLNLLVTLFCACLCVCKCAWCTCSAVCVCRVLCLIWSLHVCVVVLYAVFCVRLRVHKRLCVSHACGPVCVCLCGVGM